jgi:uncharacterized delta-60 repeat protein
MGTRTQARTNRHALVACFLIAGGLGAATACGDDGDDGGTPGDTGGSGGKGGKGGSSGKGGTSGEGGSSATGGTSGSAGAAARGGTAGTAGEGGAGSGGEETGGSGGAPGGMGGGGGDIEYWPRGVTPPPLSTTVDDRFHGVAFDASNNVYATGYFGDGVVTSGTTRQVVVAKYSSSGALVAAFGDGGLALVDISPYAGLPDDTATTASDPDPSQETGRDLVVQSNGRIVVACVTEDPTVTAPDRTTPLDIVLFRLDENGDPDLTFNATGPVPGRHTLNPGNGTNELVYGITRDANDRIYVFGHGTATGGTRTDQDRYVWRLNADGTLDTTFGTAASGFFTFDVPLNTMAGLGLNDNQRRGDMFSNGGVLSAGYTNVAGRNEIVLVKLTSGGIPDTAFSSDGIARIAPFPTGMAEAYGGAVQSDGKVVTTGYGNFDVERGTTSNFLDMVSIRVNANGSPDATWAGSGAIAYDVNAGEDRGRAILALPDDRILIAGAGTLTPNDKDPMLLLLEADGTVVADFDETGRKLYPDFASPGDEFFSVASSVTSSGGFIAAAGYAPSGATLTNGNTTLVIIQAPTD